MKKIILLLSLFLITACDFSAEELPLPKRTKEAVPGKLEKEFFNLSNQERIEKFHEYSLDDQYKLLIFGNQTWHPPLIFLTREFAKNGEAVLPFLRNKLIEADDDLTIHDIVLTFSFMSHLDLYDVKADADLMALINKKVDSLSELDKEFASQFEGASMIGLKETLQDIVNEM